MNNYKYQDLQLSDLTVYNQFKQFWNSGNYSSAISLLSSSSNLQYKVSNAAMFNALFDNLSVLQNNNDPSFKSDRIQVTPIAPTLAVGEIYFELTV